MFMSSFFSLPFLCMFYKIHTISVQQYIHINNKYAYIEGAYSKIVNDMGFATSILGVQLSWLLYTFWHHSWIGGSWIDHSTFAADLQALGKRGRTFLKLSAILILT